MNKILRVSSRGGISLVELLVVMSAASIILSLCAGLIHRVMHAETRARNLAAVERTSLRFSNAIRRDLHNASSAVTDAGQLPDGVFLRLEASGGGRLEYRRHEQTIIRHQLNQGEIIGRDQFAFPSNFELQSRFESPALVVITLTSPQPDIADHPEHAIQQATTFPVNLQVVAALRGGQ